MALDYTLAAAANLDAPAANTAAVLTYAADPTHQHEFDEIVWSYNAAPTGGRVTITDGGTTVFDMDITAAGPGEIGLRRPLRGAVNSTLVITLAAGGAAATGKLNCLGKRVV